MEIIFSKNLLVWKNIKNGKTYLVGIVFYTNVLGLKTYWKNILLELNIFQRFNFNYYLQLGGLIIFMGTI